MKKNIFVISIICFTFTGLSYADKWQIVGARAMGMGGVGVATAYGSDAQYWNPANLAEIKDYDSNIVLNIGAGIEATEKVLTVVDKLSDMADKYKDLTDKINSGSAANAEEVSTIFEGLSAISDLNFQNIGAIVDANAGLGTKIKKLAISVRTFVNSGITPIVDTQNIGLGIGSDPSNPSLGIDLGDTTDPISTENKNSADLIAATIQNTGVTDSLAALLGLPSGTTAQQIGNSLVNMAANIPGATEEQIAKMAEIIETELPKAENLIKLAGTGSYEDNKTQVLIDAGLFTELSIGYGYEVLKGLQVGANLKAIKGQMAQTGIMILDDKQNIGDAIDKALKDTTNSTQFGIDLGVMVDFERFFNHEIILNPKVGITARNINSPQFDRPDKPLDAGYEDLQWNTEKYDMGKQVRAGLAINPIDDLILACDVDVLANETFVKNFESQDLAVGLEYPIINKRAFSLPIRLGVNKNIANVNSHLAYTAGIGLYTFGFSLELAGAMSSQITTLDGTKVPASASCALSVGYLF
ncbi:MAG: conjugal transfer protein TraF [Endomicrobiaceae bacterium]|nr:conjugal transfer protein TraF [Endomicrobiaceae bacterium]